MNITKADRINKTPRYKLHTVWKNMKARCSNPSIHNYAQYGGRGVRVCDEWLSFESFYSWAMANGYQFGLELDRVDAYANYQPSNCRFVTRQFNQRNKSLYKNAAVPFIGVFKNGSRFCARITASGRKLYLGTFMTPEQAASARNQYIIANNLEGFKLNAL